MGNVKEKEISVKKEEKNRWEKEREKRQRERFFFTEDERLMETWKEKAIEFEIE